MVSSALLWLYLFDRLLRLVAIVHFFRHTDPAVPAEWPSISLIQPITRGATHLAGNLRARFGQVYAGHLQHVLVCDEGELAAQGVCATVIAEFSNADVQWVRVGAGATTNQPAVASKIEKLNAGVVLAKGEILCFIDDDIEPPADMLCRFVCYLDQPQIGAVFGLASAVSWNTPWSSLMSLFVNSNGLPTYVPSHYLSEPAQITGHLFALRASDLQRVQGWQSMEQRIDDDTELTYKLRAIGLRSLQTPVIYNVHNEFDSWQAYASQLKRWFVIPKQTVLPHLGRKEKALSTLLSVGLIVPVLMLLQAIFLPSQQTLVNLVLIIGIFYASTAWISAHYTRSNIPLHGWLLLPITLFIAPIQMLWALLFAQPVIQWRGQSLRIERGGEFQRVDDKMKG